LVDDLHRLGPVLLIWGYALACFPVNDLVKVMARRLIRLGGKHDVRHGKDAPDPAAPKMTWVHW